jgi:hypothetical protein
MPDVHERSMKLHIPFRSVMGRSEVMVRVRAGKLQAQPRGVEGRSESGVGGWRLYAVMMPNLHMPSATIFGPSMSWMGTPSATAPRPGRRTDSRSN